MSEARLRRHLTRWTSLACLGLGLGLASLACEVDPGSGEPVEDAAAADSTSSHEPGSRPDVLVITLDTTRADRLGFYGYERGTSPNLDELAAESMVYDRAYSTSSWTLPAHASLFTGQFPTSHGVRHDPEGPLVLASAIDAPEGIRARPLPTGLPTLASVLSEAGYRTGAVVAGPWLLKGFGFDRGFADYDDAEIENNAGRSAASVTDSAITWLKETTQAPDRSPTFLFLNYFDPHAPYLPPKSFVKAFLPDVQKLRMRHPPHARALYDAEILYMDSQIGRLLRFLRERALFDGTLIIITSDHGELLGEHDEWGHERFLFEELVKVPFLVKSASPPARARVAGGRSPDLVQLVDVLPMVLEAANVPLPEGVQGGIPGTTDRPTLAEVNPMSATSRTGNWRARWDGPMKFVWNDLGGRFLFDLGRDPGEANNLAAGDPDAARRFELELNRSFAELPRPTGDAGPDIAIDPETIEALRRMGYLGDDVSDP